MGAKKTTTPRAATARTTREKAPQPLEPHKLNIQAPVDDGLTDKDKELIYIVVDRDMTDGGIRINGKLYVGEKEVPRYIARELSRIQEEYFETKKKLFDKSVVVRMKSDFQKEVLFLADPDENAMKPGFTREFGLLPAKEWGYCSEGFKEQLLETRKALYGY